MNEEQGDRLSLHRPSLTLTNYSVFSSQSCPRFTIRLHFSCRLCFIDERMEHRSGENVAKLRASVIIGGWTLFGLFFASQSYVSQVYRGGESSWTQALIAWMPCAYSWALLTPAILFLARRFPFERGRWARPLILHAVAAAFFSLFALAVYVLLRRLL